MIFSAIDVIRFQSCPRRWALERSWRVIRPRPKALLDACLREGVVALSAGADVGTVRSEARARFLATAADPGMAVPEGDDPYVIASDLCAVLDTSLTAVSRLTLLSLRSIPPVPLSQEIPCPYAYSPLSLADESGALHRWLTVDAWDDDALTRELHSWTTAADIAAADAPLTLHVIVVGARRNGRHVSPWTRAFEQPLTRRLRFQKKSHGAAVDGWPMRWYADLARPDPESWVDAMIADGIMPRLILHPAIAEFPESVRRQTLDQLRALAEQMDRTARELQRGPAEQAPDQPGPPEPAMSLPMARGACHGMVECPWIGACYRPRPEYGIGALGEYSPRGATGAGSGRRGSSTAPSRSPGIAGIRASATTHDHVGSGRDIPAAASAGIERG